MAVRGLLRKDEWVQRLLQMEQANAPSRTRFVLIRGVLGFGGLTALLITLFNWYTTHRIESPVEIIVRFVIFMGVGIPFGLSVWRRREAYGVGKSSRTRNIVRLAFFIGLTVALAYALWEMTRR